MKHYYTMDQIDDLQQFIARHYPNQLALTLRPGGDDDELIVFLGDDLDATREQIDQGRDLRSMVPADIAGRLDLFRDGERVTNELDGA